MSNKSTDAVKCAVLRGELHKADTCEVCGTKPINRKASAIVAHHWNGYNHPLDVWWVCRRCNGLLSGKHDGSLTIDKAKTYIKQRYWAHRGYLV